MTDRIRRLVRDVRQAVSWASDGPGQTSTDPEPEPVSLDYDPADIEQRVDTVFVLGLEPETFVRRLLEENGGALKQQALTEYTDWSESTVSRLLNELEERGAVVRVRIGREKVVRLPEDVPDADEE